MMILAVNLHLYMFSRYIMISIRIKWRTGTMPDMLQIWSETWSIRFEHRNSALLKGLLAVCRPITYTVFSVVSCHSTPACVRPPVQEISTEIVLSNLVSLQKESGVNDETYSAFISTPCYVESGSIKYWARQHSSKFNELTNVTNF